MPIKRKAVGEYVVMEEHRRILLDSYQMRTSLKMVQWERSAAPAIVPDVSTKEFKTPNLIHGVRFNCPLRSEYLNET